MWCGTLRAIIRTGSIGGNRWAFSVLGDVAWVELSTIDFGAAPGTAQVAVLCDKRFAGLHGAAYTWVPMRIPLRPLVLAGLCLSLVSGCGKKETAAN